ncbi:helix-turn-helix transcriptional regulator [Pseudonocardia nematodicida]|uniref:Helix-turn-helix transcriptional regulator n=1 Tax=Pseudonocardia nematodicida TaxID=1206997 RepID=A0ABV1K471_9PSEU
MDNRDDVSRFLTSRRAKISPERAGLPVHDPGRRRVPGLRRQEVATLAGVSIDYYTQLERGRLSGVSEGVLDAIARALQLDDAERAHLFDLCRAANTPARPRRRAVRAVRPVTRRIVEAITDVPALVRNRRLDVLVANPLGYALYAPLFPDPLHPDLSKPANLARFCFLDPRAVDLYPAWEAAADTSVALLRTEAGRDPFDRDLSDLVGELSTRSEAFRTRWARHDVRLHRTGIKTFHHPVVGDLELEFETMELAADDGLVLTAYSPAPGTPSHDAIALLANWVATTSGGSAEPSHAIPPL